MKEKPIKILFYIKIFRQGGLESSLISWLNALDRKRFSPGLCITLPTHDFETWGRKLIPKDVPVHVIGNEAWTRAFYRQSPKGKIRALFSRTERILTGLLRKPILFWQLRSLAKQHDVICDFDLVSYKFAGRFGRPWIGVKHCSFNPPGREKAERRRQREGARLARYAAIGAVTPAILLEAQRIFHGSRPRLFPLHNIVDVEAVRARAQASAPVPEDDFIISVARLCRFKDHATLLRAYAKLAAAPLPLPRLLLLGEGPHRPVLESLVKQLGIASRVQFLGFVENPFPYVSKARALILSSLYEGAPMVIAEAMALDVPVIASDCPTGPHDMLEGGAAGSLVPVGDVAALSEAISSVLTDTLLRERLVSKGREKVLEYSPRAANQRMIAILNSPAKDKKKNGIRK